jgi:serine/threonine-protein kinase HipA
MTSERQAYVHVQLPGTLETVPAALLKVEKLPEGGYVGRFRYGNRYLERKNAIALDPFALPLGATTHEFTRLKGIPGAVRDAAPDFWGRKVIEHKLHRSPNDLEEIDCLVNGPADGGGYLSFSTERELRLSARGFNRTHQLEKLIATARDIVEGKQVPVYILEQLEPGTSMGGARPKATIEDENRLWLGKFPEKDDLFNVQRVEGATLELARRAGLDVTRSRLQTVGKDDVLMLERFDREYSPKGYFRFGMASAMTLVGADESISSRPAWSYLLLADQLRRWSTKPDADRVELFRRMVFNAAVTNDDDHPRNHAVLLTRTGWQLTPAYDLVPKRLISLEHRDLALTVGAFGRTASIFNLVSESHRFGLSKEDARSVIDSVVAVVQTWQEVFEQRGVSAKDIEYLVPAFLPECFFWEEPPQALHTV